MEDHRVSRGRPLKVEATTWNVLLEVARKHRGTRLGAQGGAPVGGALPSGVEILLHNNTGAAVSPGAVLAVGAAAYDPTDLPYDFVGRPVFEGATVTDVTALACVLLDGLPVGGVGRAVVEGLAVSRVSGGTVGGRARPTVGQQYLTGTGGASVGRVLWLDTGSDPKTAVVLLGDPRPALAPLSGARLTMSAPIWTPPLTGGGYQDLLGAGLYAQIPWHTVDYDTGSPSAYVFLQGQGPFGGLLNNPPFLPGGFLVHEDGYYRVGGWVRADQNGVGGSFPFETAWGLAVDASGYTMAEAKHNNAYQLYLPVGNYYSAPRVNVSAEGWLTAGTHVTLRAWNDQQPLLKLEAGAFWISKIADGPAPTGAFGPVVYPPPTTPDLSRLRAEVWWGETSGSEGPGVRAELWWGESSGLDQDNIRSEMWWGAT